MGMSMLPRDPDAPPVASTGIAGLDQILTGGLPRDEMHLLQGVAGTGKTTMALQFLREGARLGEATLYVTLSQSKRHLERIARSHGWGLEGVTVHELSPGTVAERIAARQTILPTADVELGELFREISDLVAEIKPRRAVIDSVSIIHLLAGSTQRYHREVVTVRQLFVERDCTVLAIGDRPAESEQSAMPEVDFHPLCGCVIHVEQDPRPYGEARRHIRVIKARGLANNGGLHDLKIRKGGMEVYPRLGAYSKSEQCRYTSMPSGVAGLDEMFGGGLDQGTACLFVGPSGTGKSTLASLYADAAMRRGDHAAIFLFDERPETYKSRSAALGMPLMDHIAAGRLLLCQLDPGEIAPGEFAQQVREAVEGHHAKVVVLDSINGYFNAMGSSDVLVSQLHELLTFLSRSGVLTLVAGAQEGFMSIGSSTGVDISYLSDTIVVLAYYEHGGELRRCMTAVKKRQGRHNTTIHELELVPGGIRVGEQLRDFAHLIVGGTRPWPREDPGDGD
jgi:circadian clock protein KaiC